MRRIEKSCLRFSQRGCVRWAEYVTESQPAGRPRLVTLSGCVRPSVAGQVIEDFGDFRAQFQTSSLTRPPRILFFEETDRELDPYDVSELQAFKERVLRDLPALQHLKSRSTLRDVQPVPLIAAQPRKSTAFIDVALPAQTGAVGPAIFCLTCSATTAGEVESLNAGWGCDRVNGRDCWYCPACYGRLVEHHPDSMAARLPAEAVEQVAQPSDTTRRSKLKTSPPRKGRGRPASCEPRGMLKGRYVDVLTILDRRVRILLPDDFPTEEPPRRPDIVETPPPYKAPEQARRERHRPDAAIREVLSFLEDVESVRQDPSDMEALERLADRLSLRWRPSLDPDVKAALWQHVNVEGKKGKEIKRRALMAGLLLVLAGQGRPQRIRFGDGTTLRADDGRTAEAIPNDFAFPYYKWWITKQASRIAGAQLVADAPEIEDRQIQQDTVPLLLVQDATCEASRLLHEILLFSPEQRRLIRKAVTDEVTFFEAARRLGMTHNTATKQIARIRQKARLSRRNR